LIRNSIFSEISPETYKNLCFVYIKKRQDYIVLFFFMRKNHSIESVFFAEASMATESGFYQAAAKEN
jgi:hypothetical protein